MDRRILKASIAATLAGSLLITAGFGAIRKLSANLPSEAHFLYNSNTVTHTTFDVWGRVSGFSTTTGGELRFNGQNPVGPVNGFFYIFRNTGGKRGGFSEHLFGDVSGQGVFENGVYTYTGTITVTGGTGRLDGATGSFTFIAHQYGDIDPVFQTTPNRVPADVVINGTYDVP